MDSNPNYLTFKDFCAKYPSFTHQNLRKWQYSRKAGFVECLRKVGDCVLIHVPSFFSWLEKQTIK